MRYEEKCSCGAALVVGYDASDFRSRQESAAARDHIEKFRRRHKDCGKPPRVSHEQDAHDATRAAS